MNNSIYIENISKLYGKKKAINHLTLTINRGMFGLLGRNGAGKTTLMKILTTITGFNDGDITICGINIKKASEIRNIIGYLPQNFMIYPNLTVYEAMDYLGAMSEIPTKERKILIPDLLKKVNLEPQTKKKVKQLSGGMRQRLGIAQALMNHPKVLIIDEPTAGLDPEERIRFRNLLCEIANDKIVILSTHIVGDIEATCEQIAVLDEGNLRYYGSIDTFINKVDGKVYSIEVPNSEVASIKKDYTVTKAVKKGNETYLRFLSDQKAPEGAIPMDPNVEDAYMYTMHRGYEVEL